MYAFRSQNERDVLKGERDMLKHIEDISELHLVIIGFLVSLINHAEAFYEEGKKKHLPTQEDINPNIKFINNLFLKIIFFSKTHLLKVFEKKIIFVFFAVRNPV